MKKYISILILVIFAVFIISCGEKNITSIISPNEITLFVGEEKEVNIETLPSDADEKYEVSFDNGIITFENNIIKGLAKGETVITLSTKKVTKEIKVTVISLDDITLSISLDKEEYSEGESAKVTINSSYEFLGYEIKLNGAIQSSDTITFNKSGLNEIVVSPIGFPQKEAKTTVDVKSKLVILDIIYSIKDKMVVNSSQEITVNVITPLDSSLLDVTVTSSDEDVISVNGKTLFAKRSGSCVIKLSCGDVTKEETITVLGEDEVTIVSNISSQYNEGELLYVQITSNLGEVDFDLSTSDSSIIKVDGKVLRFIKSGKADITISLKDNSNVKVVVNVEVLKEGIIGTEVQKILQETLEQYINSSKATVEINLTNGSTRYNELFAFEKNSNNLYNKLYHQSNSNVLSFLAIKDDMIYINLNDVKTKFECTEDEQNELMEKENLEYVLKDVTSFYFDDDFFKCLLFEKAEGTLYTYSLDIRNYVYNASKPAINVLNIDEVCLYVEMNSDKITLCKLELKSLDIVKKVEVLYQGLDFVATFPNDLDSYPE